MSKLSTHVIFDCAGTLVDVFPVAVQFLTGVAQEYGFELLPEHLGKNYSFLSNS